MSLNYDAKVRNQQEYSRSGNLGAVVAGRDFGVSELPQVDRIDWMYEQQVELTEKEQDEKMNQDAFKGLAEEQTVDKTGAGYINFDPFTITHSTNIGGLQLHSSHTRVIADFHY